jgi:hypothetical protein
MLTFGFEEAIFVDLLKDEAQSKQGNLVIANEPGVGNAHFAQMVFKDQFEVCTKMSFSASSYTWQQSNPRTNLAASDTNRKCSSMYYLTQPKQLSI